MPLNTDHLRDRLPPLFLLSRNIHFDGPFGGPFGRLMPCFRFSSFLLFLFVSFLLSKLESKCRIFVLLGFDQGLDLPEDYYD